MLAALLACAPMLARASRVFWIEYSAFRPPREPVRLPKDAESLGLETIVLATASGNHLPAWFVRSRNGAAVVLVHGSASDRSSLLAEFRGLARMGFGVLSYDAPGNGESDGVATYGDPERNALAAAVDYVLADEGTKMGAVAAYGFSMGAYTVTQVSAADPRIRAVVLAGGIPDAPSQLEHETRGHGPLAPWAANLAWSHAGFDPTVQQPIDVVSLIAPRPVMVVSGSGDNVAPAALSRRLFDAAAEPKQFLLIEGAGHGGYATADTTYLQRVATFLSSALLPPALP